MRGRLLLAIGLLIWPILGWGKGALFGKSYAVVIGIDEGDSVPGLTYLGNGFSAKGLNSGESLPNSQTEGLLHDPLRSTRLLRARFKLTSHF